MLKKIFLITGMSLCTINPVITRDDKTITEFDDPEATIQLPCTAILGERLSASGLQYFAKETALAVLLGGERLHPLQIALIVDRANNRFLLDTESEIYLRDSAEALKLRLLYKRKILQIILLDHPRALVYLKQEGVI